MKVVVVILMSIFSIGCATHHNISSLPTSNDGYKLSKGELVSKYPEIAEYEKVWRGFSPNFPLEKDVIEQLGEPEKVKRDWWYPVVMIGTALAINASPFVWGIVFAVRPDTPKLYYFEKGDYCIRAGIDRTFISGYSPYMTVWKWEENSDECKSQL